MCIIKSDGATRERFQDYIIITLLKDFSTYSTFCLCFFCCVCLCCTDAAFLSAYVTLKSCPDERHFYFRWTFSANSRHNPQPVCHFLSAFCLTIYSNNWRDYKTAWDAFFWYKYGHNIGKIPKSAGALQMRFHQDAAHGCIVTVCLFLGHQTKRLY